MATFSSQTQQALRDRLESLIKDYQAVQKRLEQVIDPVEDRRLKSRADDLEREIREIEDKLFDSPGEGEAKTSPFKGLEAFQESDAHLFFGRSRLTTELQDHLRQHNFLAIVGDSGSGKSSVIRAGVIPRLKANHMDGENFSSICLLTPHLHPLESLAVSLTQETKTTEETESLRDAMLNNTRSLHVFIRKKMVAEKQQGRFLLIIDQFEELFTRCRDELERKAFIDNLVTAVSPETAGPTTVILIIRSDFVHRCIPYKDLYSLIREHEQLISEMTEEELREAIKQPAAQSGLNFSPGLVNLILSDLHTVSAPLPLLSHALYETWQRRRGNELTFQGYIESGRVHGAIAKTAERVYDKHLDPDQQVISWNIFRRLIESGESTFETRRRATLEELISSPEQAVSVQNVLDILARYRLITIGKSNVELIHEALIANWPRLRQWLDKNNEGLIIYNRLNELAAEWNANDRHEDFLVSGKRLELFEQWCLSDEMGINLIEKAFIEASYQKMRQLEEVRLLEENSVSNEALDMFEKLQKLWSQSSRIQKYDAINATNAKQTRMLDAAIAREVILGITTELVAQVRLKSSPGLKGVLELDIDYDPQPDDVKSRSVQLEFPLDEQQKPQGIFLLLRVASHDFKPPAQTKKIIVPPDADSETCVFQLIPLRIGQLGILLEVYDTGEVVTASTKIRVNCQENHATAINPENRILVSLPLVTSVRPFSETKQEALQKRWEELIEEYKAIMAEIGYESNSASKLKLERQASVISDEIRKVEQQLQEKNALPANIGEHQEVINVLRQAIMEMESGDFDRAIYRLQELEIRSANRQISRLHYKVVENKRQFDDLLSRGIAAYEARDYQEAIDRLQAALSIKPGDTEARARLAHIEIQFDELLRKGAAAYEAKDYREAIGGLQAALSIKPYHGDALALLAEINAQFKPLSAEGQSSLEANDFRQAAEKLSQALSIRPDHQEVRVDLEFALLLVDGEKALESKDYKVAVYRFETALSIKPYHHETHINLHFALSLADSQTALEANDYQQAVAKYRRALSIKPDHKEVRTDLRFASLLAESQAALKAEKYRYAIHHLNEALSIKPGDQYTLDVLSKVDGLINSLLVEAQTALEANDYQQAVEKFDQVLSVKPDHQEAKNDQQFASLLLQGQKAVEGEDYRQVIYLLNEALSIKPNHEHTLAMLARVNDRFDSIVGKAQIALEAKDYQQAVDRFNQAITIKPDHQEVQDSLRLALSNLDRSLKKRTHLLAQVDRLIAVGNFDQALQLCEDTIELNPDDVEFVLRVRRAEDGLAKRARWQRNQFLLLGGTIIFLFIVISIFLIARGIGQ